MAAILKYIQPRLHALSNGMFANWSPENAVSVGDYGVLKNGGFERLGSLRDYGAHIDTQPASSGENEFEFKDKIDLLIGATAGATIPGKQGAKVRITIRGKGAFLYHLFNAHWVRPVNQRIFEEEVARTLIGTALVLPEKAVLVTEVQHAAKATIIASDHSEGKLDLATSFKPIGSAFLSGARGTVSVGASAGSIFSWIARDDTVTLLRLVRPTVPPPGGPGTAAAAGKLQTALEWMRNLFKARELSVSELVIRPLPDSSSGMVVAIGKDELQLRLPELTLEEMMATVTHETAEEADDEPAEIEIPEQRFGTRSMTG